MPRLGCETRLEKTSMDLVDRVLDLRNRVKWLKNVEFCLLADQNERIDRTKSERHRLENVNETFRKQLAASSKKQKPTKTFRLIEEKNRLIYLHHLLIDRLKSVEHRMKTEENIVVREFNDENSISRRLREVHERLISAKLINRTLIHCKQYLQCDLDLLRKELPTVEKEIRQKFNQRSVLRKEFLEIVAENKQRLKTYEQLLSQTEFQTRQRRQIHHQTMNSVAEQLEDQYQLQTISQIKLKSESSRSSPRSSISVSATNEMNTSFENRKFNNANGMKLSKGPTAMNNDEVVQVRCMYDQFYNIVTAGVSIDIDNCEKLKKLVDEVSVRTTSLVTLTKRLIEEKDQLDQQRIRTEKLRDFIDMAMSLKMETREEIVEKFNERRRVLEKYFLNDRVENQNRIIRQINDFLVVLSKSLWENHHGQLFIEPTADFLERLQIVCTMISKAMKQSNNDEHDDEDDRQVSPETRRSFAMDETNSQSRLIDQSMNSSLSSISLRPKRNSLRTNIY